MGGKTRKKRVEKKQVLCVCQSLNWPVREPNLFWVTFDLNGLQELGAEVAVVAVAVHPVRKGF